MRGLSIEILVVSNPEFLKEGSAIQDFMHPDRVVVGSDDTGVRKQFSELYKPFILDDDAKLIFMSRRSSELTKYSANAMLATRISFMNEMAILCESVGANIDDIRKGIGSDGRIGKKFLYAGPGYGGSCFPKDVSALLKIGEKNNVKLNILNAVEVANLNQKNFILRKIREKFPTLLNTRITVWGLSFKPETDDVRESPSYSLVEDLLNEGAIVSVHDPEGMANFSKEIGSHPKLKYCEESYEGLKDAQALVLMTEWSEYRVPNWSKIFNLMSEHFIFDFRNQYNGIELELKGFRYSSIGRPDQTDCKALSAKNLSPNVTTLTSSEPAAAN